MIKNIHYVAAGHFTSCEQWKHPRITVPTTELIYITEGSVHLYEGAESFSAKEGDIVRLSPRTEHGGTLESAGRVSFFWLHISCDDKSDEEEINSLPRVLSNMQSTQFPIFMRQILHCSNLSIYPKEMSDILAVLLIMEYEISAKERIGKGNSSAALVNRVKEWIRINSSRQLNAKSVAEEFGYNVDYLTRFFKDKTGESLKELIDKMRMSALRTALLTTDKELKNIAVDFGFGDYKSFLKFFTYHEGVTPTQFRKSCYMTHKNNK